MSVHQRERKRKGGGSWEEKGKKEGGGRGRSREGGVEQGRWEKGERMSPNLQVC